jgi:NAD(P)-dependent dehydrogenase (short-subunit alcohol dehydrogenase family)
MIIFGGTRGIGSMFAEYYKKNGFKVSIAGRYPKYEGMQDKINIIKADVSKETSVEAAFDLHLKQWGKNPDVVVNCAGIQGPIGNSWIIPAKKFGKP